MQNATIIMALEALKYYKKKYIVDANLHDWYGLEDDVPKKKVQRIMKAIKELELLKKARL